MDNTFSGRSGGRLTTVIYSQTAGSLVYALNNDVVGVKLKNPTKKQ